MKISKLLVLSALWLVGLSANAGVELIERTVPEAPASAIVDVESLDMTPAEFVVGNYYVIYNVGSGQFFGEGNSWGTQASLSDVPNLSYFSMPEGKSLEDATLYFNDYSAVKNSWKKVFFDSATAMFVDLGSQANYFWQVVPVDGKDNTYYLQASPSNPTLNPTNNPGYVGVAAEAAKGSALSPFLAEGWIEWQFIPVPEWSEYGALKVLYDRAMALKAIIEEAEAEKIDVTEAVVVYNNLESTVEQIDAAIKALREALANNIAGGTADNPTDATTLINNPNFDNGSNEGWLGDKPNMNGDGNHLAANVAEKYNSLFNTYQNLTGMPDGVYGLSLRSLFRGTLDDLLAGTGKEYYPYAYAVVEGDTLTTLFKNAYAPMNTESFVTKYGSTTYFYTPNAEGSGSANGVTYYIPNNPSTFRLYCEEEDAEGNNKMYYDTKLFFEVTGGKATIGIKKDALQGGSDWAVFDSFGLKYYGKEAKSFDVWVKNMAAAVVFTDETVYTQSYMDDYNTACAVSATNKAEALAAIEAIDTVAAKLQKNINLWKELQKVADEANEVGADGNLDPTYAGPLADWAEFEYPEDILPARELTNEELDSLIAVKRAEIEEARKHPKGTNVDMTALLVNPDFEQGETGWTGFNSARRVKYGDAPMPVTGGTATNTCAEAFSTTEFDLYQIVTNAPVGVYEISVQGFCRNGRDDNAWNNYQNQSFYSQPGKFPVWVYLNAKKTPFKSVFEEPVEEGFYKGVDSGSEVYVKDGMEFPDGMVSSAVAFAKGMYKQTAIGLVAREGDSLRIGVKGHSNGLDGEDDNWVIFDNFQLTWKGYQADIIKPALEEELTKAQKRVNETMGKTAYTHLMTAIGSAQIALQGEDGEVMFNALSALFEVDDEVTASVEAFKNLDTALALLSEEMGLHTDSPALEDASNLMDEITGNIGNHVYTDADVEALIAKINEMVVKLRIPVYNVEDITDLNPVDFTALINNPTYDEGLDGWTYEVSDVQDENEKYKHGGDAGNAQFYRCNYDYYQEISGLPAGTYRVAVTGFFRSGNAAEEWARKDSVKYSRAFVYAIGENGTMNNKALTRLSENYIETSTVEGDYAVVKTDTVDLDAEIYNYTLLANMQSAAGDMFYQNLYSPYELTNEGKKVLTGEGNMVTVKVGEDGKLRIGLYKKVTTGDFDWTVWDDWTLWYFGPNSALLPSGDNDQYEEEQGIAIVNLDKAIRVETFTLDGRKVTSKQRGIVIQRMTMPDGSSVVIKKIRK